MQSTETKVEAAKVATVATSTLGFAQSSFAAQSEEVVGNLAGIDGRRVSMAESPSSSCLRRSSGGSRTTSWARV